MSMDADSQDDAPGQATPRPSRSFSEAMITFAVDTSGSTHNGALEAEKRAIRSITSLLPQDRQPKVVILPWNDTYGAPIRLSSLESMHSDGGTNPAVLFDTPKNVSILAESHFWFLMTDGIIEPMEIHDFTHRVTKHGMHGKACVIVIVGQAVGHPGMCNISVGLAVFATSPHVAFLFLDQSTRQTYILGVKGCFTELLSPGQSSKSVHTASRWADLPKTSFENLSRVNVPPPQAVGKNEIILEGGNVNLDTLFSQQDVSEALVHQILDNRQNRHSISVVAKSMGRAKDLEQWLDKVDQTIDLDESSHSADGPEAAESITELLAELMSPSIDPAAKSDAQRRLSAANQSWEQTRKSSSRQVSDSRRHSSGHMRRVSRTSVEYASDNLVSNLPDIGPVKTRLCNPGFFRPQRESDYVRGRCMLCNSDHVLICLHLVKPPSALKTQRLPGAGSAAQLRYPLAMGNFPETDVISSFFSCDPCSVRLMKNRKTPHGETIVANLPLVSYAANREAWIETLALATDRRFSGDDLAAVFLAMLATKVERSPGEQRPQSLLNYILTWCCDMLLKENATVSGPDEDAYGRRGGGHGYRVPLLEWLRKDFQTALSLQDTNTLLLYPLDGFVTANVLLSNSMSKNIVSHERRRTIVWTRLLCRLAERYYELVARESALVVDAAAALLLLQDRTGDKASLFRLEKLRYLSLKPSPDDKTKSAMELFQSIGAMLTTRVQRYRLSFTPARLADTPFLRRDDLQDFERLGSLFTWISDEAGHALAVFLHSLLRCEVAVEDPRELFLALRDNEAIQMVFVEPRSVSAKVAEDRIKDLPALGLKNPAWRAPVVEKAENVKDDGVA